MRTTGMQPAGRTVSSSVSSLGTQGMYKLTRKNMFSLLDSAVHKDRAEARPLVMAQPTHHSCLKKRHAFKEPQGGHSFGAGSAMRKSPHCMGVTSQTTKHVSTTSTALQLHRSLWGWSGFPCGWFLRLWARWVARWYSRLKSLPLDP